MLQSVGSQRVRHDRVTKQQQQNGVTILRQIPWWLSSRNHLPVQETRSANARDVGLISGSGRSPGEGNGNPLQYPYLENPRDRGAWRATVHETKTELDMTEQLNINSNNIKTRNVLGR